MPESSGYFFLAQVVLTILCAVPEPRTAVFRLIKPKQKKETSEVFVSFTFWWYERSKPFKNLEFLAKWGVLLSSEEDMKKFERKKRAKPFLSSRIFERGRKITTRDAKKLWFLFSCTGCSYNSFCK